MVRRATPPASAVTAEAPARSRPTPARRRSRARGRPAETDRLRHLSRARIEAHDRAVAAVRDPQRGRGGEHGRRPVADRRRPATAFVPVSIRTSALSPAFATQAPASLTAIAAGPWPTGIVVATSVAGSMRVTVPSALFVTQTEPAPAAIADGAFPTPTVPRSAGTGIDSQDDPVGTDDPDRPERRQRGPHRPAEEPAEVASGRVEREAVVPRVDRREVAVAVGHPDGVRRGGERSRCAADRNGPQRLTRRDVDPGHGLVVEIRDPQRTGARSERDRSRSNGNARRDRAGRVEGDDRVRRSRGDHRSHA